MMRTKDGYKFSEQEKKEMFRRITGHYPENKGGGK